MARIDISSMSRQEIVAAISMLFLMSACIVACCVCVTRRCCRASRRKRYGEIRRDRLPKPPRQESRVEMQESRVEMQMFAPKRPHAHGRRGERSWEKEKEKEKERAKEELADVESGRIDAAEFERKW